MEAANMEYASSGADAVRLSQHAIGRMSERSISPTAVSITYTYGRVVYTRGAKIRVIGRKEVERYRQQGKDLSQYEGIHLVCNTDGLVFTVYRNKDSRGLRPRRRSRYHGPRRATSGMGHMCQNSQRATKRDLTA